jgi:cellulose synthase/poly-beta-1,6-N-acetylglucosamine synthase-like glycosyltransferase
MIGIAILWVALFFLSFGAWGLYFLLNRKKASRPWRLSIDKNYTPKVSILVPTYNESSVIHFKLQNLKMVKYPKEFLQIVIVDSESTDNTMGIVKDFVTLHPEINIDVVEDTVRRGKSPALNLALGYCRGDVVIISDADCFWPKDILLRTMPFLADPTVGAVSGPKVLLNPGQSLAAKSEDTYLNSMNLIKLGESKAGSTLLFEGGFSAYKREALESFDPYSTGSDDCGTIVKLAEKNLRALFVPEGLFYTTFPNSWKERVGMKTRRASQLVRVFWKYWTLLAGKRIKSNRLTIASNVFIYLLSPIFFVLLLPFTALVFIHFPYLVALLLLLLLPRVGPIFLEVIQGFVVLLCAFLTVASKRNYLIWQKPADRNLLTEEMLSRRDLI